VPVLTPQQRTSLEDACTKGRRVTEQAVRAALTSLAITAERPPAHLNEEDRQLRRGLRAKARQLGDKGDDVRLLVAECAYEQWHRLLFARFLAETNLLIHPEYRAPVTLGDCDELAESLGEPDGWSVAAQFAAEILPGIFRLDDPCVRIRLAPEGRLALEAIVGSLPAEVFVADDALGWVYQYWQKDQKDEVNASERKIGGADLGPVTQLFTENYMVRFLLENSLGAWWAARHPDSALVKSFEYLRFDQAGEPAAGRFQGWPDRVAEVTVMDPCCGSGHFLVEAFSMLWQMRAEEEGLSPVDAQDAALRDNLFGLELDPRCVQIAMFAVALQAWKTAGRWRELPVPSIACSGVPVRASLSEWTQLGGGDVRVEGALERIHTLFRHADTLGSLIDPLGTVDPSGQSQRSFDDADWSTVAPALEGALSVEADDPATAVLGAGAAGAARAAQLLARRYTMVATNVPYLTRQSQSDQLRAHIDREFSGASLDLATAFVARSRRMIDPGGVLGVVCPQGWTYQPTYEPYRRECWSTRDYPVLALLGPGAFGGISGEVVSVALVIEGEASADDVLQVLDVSSAKGPGGKAESLLTEELLPLLRSQQLRNPKSRLVADARFGTLPFLYEYAESYYGTGTGDFGRFGRFFWEVADQSRWAYEQGTVSRTIEFGGREAVVDWSDGSGALASFEGAFIRNAHVWGSHGVCVNLTGELNVSLYTGDIWDSNCAAVIPKRAALLPAIWAFLSDPLFGELVRVIDRSLKVMNQTLLDIPFDLDHWSEVALERYPLGLPEPSSTDPTQWLFDGRPEASTSPLHVAVARLIGFRWPEQDGPGHLDDFADADGIVCLPSVAGEAPAADRLQQLLGLAFGPSWSPAKLKELLEESGSKKKNLGDWLRDDFFKQHCGLFGNRPFIWHIWDGHRDGFAALVNYHCLDRKTLEKLTYTYLGDWIERQRAELRDERAGAEARLAAASKLRSSLELILDGEPPYDIYVRWKSLSAQPIGWDPDVNDGVRVNVRPFVEAGVLRSTFNVHWKKDRGKDPDGSERLNDLHITTAEKRAARGGSA